MIRAHDARDPVYAGISPGTSGAESRSSAYSIERMTGVEVASAFTSSPSPRTFAWNGNLPLMLSSKALRMPSFSKSEADNSLDACEEAGIAPCFRVTVAGGKILVPEF